MGNLINNKIIWKRIQEDQNIFDIRKIKLLFKNNYYIILWAPFIFIKFSNPKKLYYFFNKKLNNIKYYIAKYYFCQIQ